MAIVADFYDGNTHVRIDDSLYRDRTPEQHQESVNRAFAVAQKAEERLARERAEKAARESSQA